MFKPVPYKLAKQLRNVGSLELRVIPTPNMFKQTSIPSIKNAVVFRGSKHDTWPTKLFECDITKLERLMVFSDVRVNADVKIDEGSVHYFLGLLVEMAEVWAKWAGKNMVVIESRLPHVTEWFVEHGWRITPSDRFGNERGFRGTKILLEAKQT